MPELIDGAKGEAVSRIAKKLEEHHQDSVNIFALTSDAEVILYERELELPYDDEEQEYLSLLRRALSKS